MLIRLIRRQNRNGKFALFKLHNFPLIHDNPLIIDQIIQLLFKHPKNVDVTICDKILLSQEPTAFFWADNLRLWAGAIQTLELL